MQDWLRDQISDYLAENRVATLCTGGGLGVSATLVSYCSTGLALDCWVPRWADALYHLEQSPQVTLVIPLGDQENGMRWLHYQGCAELAPATPADSVDHLSCRVRVTPRRIDLIDEQHGPGIRATLEG